MIGMAGQDNRGIGSDPINCLETSAGLANSKQVMLHRTNGRGGSELFDESGFLVLRGKFSWQRVGGRSYDNDYAQVQKLRLKHKKPIPPYWEEEIKQGELNVIHKSH